uniref:Uncharacterized protein n=1 Tax=Octopus bimaculoides TaxID=37653 RepID=A0A0L8I366_OCTBM
MVEFNREQIKDSDTRKKIITNEKGYYKYRLRFTMKSDELVIQIFMMKSQEEDHCLRPVKESTGSGLPKLKWTQHG